jgi:hypothetical protein
MISLILSVQAKADMIVVSVHKDGSISVTDQFSPGYGRPSIDSEQNVFDIHTRYEGGKLWANFSRALLSKDGEDISLDRCLYLLFPNSGGPLEGGSGELRKHFQTPTSKKARYCETM